MTPPVWGAQNRQNQRQWEQSFPGAGERSHCLMGRVTMKKYGVQIIVMPAQHCECKYCYQIVQLWMVKINNILHVFYQIFIISWNLKTDDQKKERKERKGNGQPSLIRLTTENLPRLQLCKEQWRLNGMRSPEGNPRTEKGTRGN